jgi:UPF0176 protein
MAGAGTWLTVSFYHFADLSDCTQIKQVLVELCQQQRVYGLIILAPEGVNGTLACQSNSIEVVLDYLTSDPRLLGMQFRRAYCLHQPFFRMNIRLKREIVTMGVPNLHPQASTGTYVEPEEWNRLLQDPDLILIDTRNDYEVALGSFIGAINPQINKFSDFPAWLDQQALKRFPMGKETKVAMFCTGGIRCEKSTAYMRAIGFEQVFHLRGGILNYLESIETERSLWHGECFVFDERVSVGHALKPGDKRLCRVCRHPLDQAAHLSDKFEEGVSCPQCHGTSNEIKKRGARERQRQCELATAKNQAHIGAKLPIGIK